MNDLYDMCVAWDGTPEQFAQIMTVALRHLDARTLGGMFETLPSTATRWASGASVPLPGMQKVAVKMLKFKAAYS